MKNIFVYFFLFVVVLVKTASAEESVIQLEDITIVGEKKQPQVSFEPGKITIDPQTYKSATIPQNMGDILKDMVIMDFQGQSNLVPGYDTLYMRGFDSKRFIISFDGFQIRNSGGRPDGGIIDYGTLVPFLIDSVEILPGPHSALYGGESIGGVVNFKTRAPKRYETLKPDITVSSSYGSYNTQNHNLSLQGGLGEWTYDIGYQKYLTDGYLRNNKADIDNLIGRIGYILPNEGYITLTTSYADIEREIPVVNDPAIAESNYDENYPIVTNEVASLYSWQNPETDKTAHRYQLDFNLPTSWGTWDAKVCYREEIQDRYTLVWANPMNHAEGIKDGSWKYSWKQQGIRITNEFHPFFGHTTTIGGEVEQLYDKDNYHYNAANSARLFIDHYTKRNENFSGFFQDKWDILPQLSLTAGLRFDSNTVRATNYNPKTGKYYLPDHGMWVKKTYSGWSPKSFLTYKLDNLANMLRDTSISLGISRIWRPPSEVSEFQREGIPSCAWLKPEHGIGYDIIISRRLIGDIVMQVGYSYYKIKDYIAFNETNTSGIENMINIDEVDRYGVEVQLAGSLTDHIDFRLGYAWQDLKNKGGELAGNTEIDNVANNRVNANLLWSVLESTTLIFDYEYQDKQVVLTTEEITPNEFVFHNVPLESYHVVDLAVEHNLFKQWWILKDCKLKFYIKNLFNEEYQNTLGYPATDRTVGVNVSFTQ